MTARRHHYVPRFLLDRFSEAPGTKGSAVWQLDKSTGQQTRTNPTNAAVRRDFYSLADREDLPDDLFEQMLARLEARAATVTRNGLITPLIEPSPADREGFAIFIGLMMLRVPSARTLQRGVEKQVGEAQIHDSLVDRTRFEELFRRVVRPDASTEEVEAARDQMLDRLAQGDFAHTPAPQSQYLDEMFDLAVSLGEVIEGMSWTVVVAPPTAKFILSDDPVSTFDPSPEPGRPAPALLSSSYAETIFPFDAQHCLRLTREGPRAAAETATSEVVSDFNLRTYAYAERWVYGSSQHAVTSVRAVARRHRGKVARYARRPRKLVFGDGLPGGVPLRRTFWA